MEASEYRHSWRGAVAWISWTGLRCSLGSKMTMFGTRESTWFFTLLNSQMCLSPSPKTIGSLDPTMLQNSHSKPLRNYTSWCSYLGRKSQGTEYPWQALKNWGVNAELLTIFITWDALHFLQFVLDAGTPIHLVIVLEYLATEVLKLLENACLWAWSTRGNVFIFSAARMLRPMNII